MISCCLAQALSGIFLGIGGGTAANRQYFVQAEQVTWDYAPQGQYMCNEVPRPFADAEVGLFSCHKPQRRTMESLCWRCSFCAAYRQRLCLHSCLTQSSWLSNP